MALLSTTAKDAIAEDADKTPMDLDLDINESKINISVTLPRTEEYWIMVTSLDKGDTGRYTISLDGSAASSPQITISPDSIDYSSVNVGEHVDKTFVVKNEGTALLSISSTTLVGADASEFSIQSGGGSFSLNPGATRNVVVRFEPQSAGDKNATLRITSNDPYEDPFDVPLSGSISGSSGMKWEFETGSGVYSSPAIGSDGTIYVGSNDDYLYAINSDSMGLADSPWPKFHHDNQNTGRVPMDAIVEPTITGIEPSSGSADGGTVITITGENFVDGATVKIGGKLAIDVKVVSATKITATTPAGSEGTANVVVTNPDGKSATLKDGFTYTPSGPVATLSITSAEASPGANITVQISITDATGVAGGDINVKYDANTLTVGEVKSTDLISGMTLMVSKDAPGEIKLSMAGAQEIPSGNGALIEIELTLSADAQVGTETTLEFGDTEIYDVLGMAIPIQLTNRVVKIAQLGIKGDVNNDGKIRANDAILALRIVVGMMEPDEYQKWAADINDDGKVRANDAILILRKATGLAAPIRDVLSGAGGVFTVTLGKEAHGVAGESVTVPLKISKIDGLAGGDIRIAYDSKVLRAVEASSDSDVLFQSNIAEPGMIQITFASADRLNSKTVAKILFDILTDDVSPLTIENVELYRFDALPFDSRKIDGQFSSWAIPPEQSGLLQNFPNPFNPETWIPYQLAQDSEVTISIYDGNGQLVRFIDLDTKPAGVYFTKDRAIFWNGTNSHGEKVASGLYFYQLKAGNFSATRKMVILK